MKSRILSLVLLCFVFNVQSQTISRKTFSTLGGFYSDSNFSATFTIGETIINTVSTGNNIMTQGFQQPSCFPLASSFSASATDSYTWNTNTYTLSGTYSHTYLNAGGCDSVVTLHLIVYHTTVTMTLQNVVQISPNVFEYDVTLTNTGNTTLALKGYSCGINHATGMRGTGTITHTYVSRAPSLSTIPIPAPGYTPSNNHLRFITSNASSGNEVTFIPNATIRIATMRVTNSIPFPVNFVPDFTMQTLTAIGKTQSFVTCIVTPPGTSYNVNGIGNSNSAGTIQGLTALVNTPCLYLNPTSSFMSTITQTIPVTCYGQSNGMIQITLSGNGSSNPVGSYTVDGGSGIPYSTNPFLVSNLSEGTHTIAVNMNNGCSSINIANIMQPTIISTTSSLEVCNNYTWDGISYTSSGTPTHTYVSSSGCDSLHTLNLIINNSNSGSSSVIACNSYNWNGTIYNSSGTYTQTFINVTGCDSVHTLALTINQGATSLTTIGSCDSYSWNGTTYTNSGTYFQSFTNAEGCDSIASLLLTINNTHILQSDTIICAGSSITLNASSTSNNLPSNLQNGLMVWYPFNGNANDESGNGNNLVTHGSPAFVNDVHNNSNSAAHLPNGNDYFLTPTSSWSFINNFPHGSVSFWVNLDSSYISGHYFGIDNSFMVKQKHGVGEDLFFGIQAGSTKIRFQVSGQFPSNSDLIGSTNLIPNTWYHVVGTWDGIFVKLYLNGNIDAVQLSNIGMADRPLPDFFSLGSLTYAGNGTATYPSGTYGILDDIGIWNRALSPLEINQLYSPATSYNWSTGDTTSSISVTPTQTTTYYLTTNNGTSSCIDSVTVTVNHPSVNAGTSQSICQGDSVTLTAIGASTYQWSNSVINSQAFVPSNTQTYTVTGTNSMGCTATAQVEVSVNPKPIPTITPTGPTTLCDGNSVVLIANSGIGLTYKWYKDGTEILGATSSSFLVSQSGNYEVEEKNASNCSNNSPNQSVTVNSCDVNLHLKLFYQGYYTGASTMTPVLLNQGVSIDSSVTDTILVELHSPLPPYGFVLSKQAILHTDGNANCTFNYVYGNYYLDDSYYVVIKHRNGLTTWSTNPINFNSTNVSYDFTTTSSQAYGDNMIEVEPGVWAFYTGELNYDDNIDLIDNPLLESDINNFEFGYFITDLNGDGNCDLIDVPILEANIFNFVFSYQPAWTGSLPTVITSTVTSVIGGSAVCGGNVTNDGGSSILARGVCWSLNPHPTITDSKTNDGVSLGSYSSNLTSLNPNTTYYARAYVTNEVGTVYGNEVSFVSDSLFIGMNYQGGKVAYILQPGDIGYIDGETHGIIAAPLDQGNVQWGCTATFIGGTSTLLESGQTNTMGIISGCNINGTAAKLCDDLLLNGYNDWYLPSKSELEKLYLNRNVIGGFTTYYYWSSSEFDLNNAWCQTFDTGNLNQLEKFYNLSVRAVRSF